jgi:pimeloyl-ACP methyl ester carboxylesterase
VARTARSDDGTRIVYEIVGEGAPLVLVHGSATFRGLWHALGYVEALAPEFQLILLDVRGHGESEKPREESAYAMKHLVADVLAVLDDSGVERTHYFGYSLGGRIGFALAARAPERLRTLVVGGGSHRPQRGALDRVLYPGFLDTIANRGIDAFLDEFGEHLGAPLDPATRAVFQGADPEALVAYFRATDNDLGVPGSVLCELEVPALLFAGEHDDERLADSRAAAAAMPHARLEVLSGLDHVTALGATNAVLAIVKPFIAETRTGEPGTVGVALPGS